MSRPFYFKIHTDYWNSDKVRSLSMEQLGVFISLLIEIFASELELVDNDNIPRAMFISKIKWEKIKAVLLEKGLIYLDGKYVLNDYIVKEYKDSKIYKKKQALANVDLLSYKPEEGKFKTVKCSTGEVCKSYAEYLKSQHWQNVKDEYYFTYTYLCDICEDNINLHLHHTSYENLGNENIEEDLVYLCPTCHAKVHGKF